MISEQELLATLLGTACPPHEAVEQSVPRILCKHLLVLALVFFPIRCPHY